MLRQLRYAAAALALAVPAVVCAQQAATPPPGPGEAARVGDRVITLKEVDEAWRQADPVEHTRATQMLYEGRKTTLEEMIANILIEQAAKAKSLTPAQFAEAETAKRIKPISDADITSFYEQNKARMQGKPLEEMRPAIRSFLEQQQQASARAALVAELKKSGPPVRLGIDPPRREVAVAATDPARGPADAPVTIVEFSDYQ
jgi:protein-disulfide isomerase